MKRIVNKTNGYIVIGILVIGCILFRRMLFQGYGMTSLKFNSDLVRANLPTYIEMYDLLFKRTSGLWSWRMAAGTSMFSHSDALFDPFTYITFLAGRNNIGYMMIWVLYIKIIAEGLSISLYIKRFTDDNMAIVAASIMYAFSGYSLIMGTNLALGTILVYAPLVLLGLEKMLNHEGIKTLLISLFATAVWSIYYFYVISALSVLYLLVRELFVGSDFTNTFKLELRLVMCILLASMIGAFSILPQMYMMYSNKRLNSGKDFAMNVDMFIPSIKVIATYISRIIGINTLGDNLSCSYKGYAGFVSGDFFQNECFVSCFVPVLFTQYLFFVDKKQKNRTCLLSFLCFISVSLPIFSYCMNAFSTVNMRWIFIWDVIGCLFVAMSITEIRKAGRINIPIYIMTCFLEVEIIYLSISYIYKVNGYDISSIISAISSSKKYFIHIAILYLVLLSIGLFSFHVCNKHIHLKYKNSLLLVFIMAIIMFDTVANYGRFFLDKTSLYNVNDQVHTDYCDESSILINDVKREDCSWYRIYKNFDSVYDNNTIPSDNDSMAQGYLGLKCYNSNNNSAYVDFLQTMGVYVAVMHGTDDKKLVESGRAPEQYTGSNLNYINGVDDKYDLLRYMGVKYYIARIGSEIPDFFSQYPTKEIGNLIEFKIDDAYPLAFINSMYIDKNELMKMTYSDRIEKLLDHTIVDNGDLYTSDKITRRIDAKLIEFSYDDLKVKINSNKNHQLLCFTIPYDKGWVAYVNGEKVLTSIVNIGFIGVNVDAGINTVSLKYSPVGWHTGMLISLFSFVILSFIMFCKKNRIKKNIS